MSLKCWNAEQTSSLAGQTKVCPSTTEKFHGFGRAGAIWSYPEIPALVFISRDQNFRIPSDLTIPCCQLYNIPPESQGWSSHKILVISPAYLHKSHSSLTLTMKRRLVSLSSRNIHTCFFKGRAKWWLTQPSWKGPGIPQKTGSSHLHLESHLSRRKSNV